MLEQDMHFSSTILRPTHSQDVILTYSIFKYIKIGISYAQNKIVFHILIRAWLCKKLYSSASISGEREGGGYTKWCIKYEHNHIGLVVKCYLGRHMQTNEW